MNNKPVAWMNNNGDTVITENKEDYGSAYDAYTIPLYTHPVKELHLSLQKEKETGELLAVTYTDDEHRIVEVLWQRPPVKELTDEEIECIRNQCGIELIDGTWRIDEQKFARAILRKAQEK